MKRLFYLTLFSCIGIPVIVMIVAGPPSCEPLEPHDIKGRDLTTRTKYPPSVRMVAPEYAVRSLSDRERIELLESEVQRLTRKNEQMEGWITRLWRKNGL